MLLRPRVDARASAAATVLASGKPACPGVAIGTVVTDADDAQDRDEDGEDVVLARPTTDPDDVPGMSVCAAVVTEHDGSTSHAAVVCREMAVPCVVGCSAGTVTALDGRVVTVDGTTGVIYDGALPVAEPAAPDDPDLAQLGEWARARAGASGSLIELLRARRPAAARGSGWLGAPDWGRE